MKTIYEYRRMGLSYRAISKITTIPKSTVYDRCRKVKNIIKFPKAYMEYEPVIGGYANNVVDIKTAIRKEN